MKKREGISEFGMKNLVVGLIVLVLLSVLLIGFCSRLYMTLIGKAPIYLAVIGPMSGPYRISGNAMFQGAQLYLDHARQQHVLEGREVKLLTFNDQNNPRVAARIASELAGENKVLLVLGHYFSDPSLAAGEIYQKNGIPAITASATVDALTHGNEWYFRTIPNNSFQGAFIASYIKDILQHTTTSIIFDQDNYGASLKQSYEKAILASGMTIAKTWSFDRNDSGLDNQLKTIVTELRALRDPGVIFFATHDLEAVKLITTIHVPDSDYTIIGPDSFSTNIFIEEFQRYPQEQISPGYYSDGIYAVAPFIRELAAGKSQTFRWEFRKRYHEEPSWEAACYYDAMAVALDAIKRAEIEGKKEDIRSDRRKIREALASLSNLDVAFSGITGDIYFEDGDTQRPPVVGIYTKQHLIPAYAQYHSISETEPGRGSLLQETLKQKFMTVGKTLMKRVQIVSTGIDVNEISNFDMDHSRYTVDFYLWFRFQEDFDDNRITFLNAVHPITIGNPVFEKREATFTVRAYRIKGDFQSELDFHAYPFETHRLRVMFRHTTRLASNLLYVPDTVGISPKVFKKNVEKTSMNAITGWGIDEVTIYQDIFSLSSQGEDLVALIDPTQQLTYSQFTIDIGIKRTDPSSLVKSFFPILVVIVGMYLVYFLPAERPGVRFMLCMSTLVISALYQFWLSRQFPVDYLLAIEYAYLTTYGLGLMAVFITLLSYHFYKQGHNIRVRILTGTGRVLHLLLTGISVVLVYLHKL